MDEWYYAENGESVGPVAADVVARVVAEAGDQGVLVWSPDLPDWVDGRDLPQFAAGNAVKGLGRDALKDPLKDAFKDASRDAAPAALFGAGKSVVAEKRAVADSAAGSRGKSLIKMARHEFLAYLGIAAYLMVWFCALMFYKSTVLKGAGVDLAPFGVGALIKSLILAKFILLLEAVRLGERRGKSAILIVQIAMRALIFTVALAIMTVIEEIVVGYFHGHGAKESLGGMIAATSPSQVLAVAILMFLVLVPYLAFRRIALEVGQLPELLFTRRGIKETA
jgi:hypothetical protein